MAYFCAMFAHPRMPIFTFIRSPAADYLPRQRRHDPVYLQELLDLGQCEPYVVVRDLCQLVLADLYYRAAVGLHVEAPAVFHPDYVDKDVSAAASLEILGKERFLASMDLLQIALC